MKSHVERALEAILDTSADWLLLVDPEHCLVRVGRTCARALGQEPEALVGLALKTLPWSPGVLSRLDTELQHVFQTGEPVSGELIHAGTAGQLHLTYRWEPLCDDSGRPAHVLFTGTGRALATVQAHAIVEATAIGIAVISPAGSQTYVNPAFCQMLGWPAEALLGSTPPYCYWAPEEQDAITDAFTRTLDGQVPEEGFELLLRRASGARFRALIHPSPVRDSTGAITGWVAAITDIEKRVRTEKALQESELKLRSLFEHARDAIGISRGDQILYVNPAYARLLGYDSPEEMIGLSTRETVAPGEWARLSDLAQQRRRGLPAPFAYEYRGRRRDGTEVELENYVSVYELDGELHTIVTTRDITVRKQAERAQQFLNEASAVLASSLDYQRTLNQVANLAVPHIADWCGVDMLESDGSIRSLAVAHVDPEKVKWAREIRELYPPDPEEKSGLPNVLRTGKPEVYTAIPDALLVAGARDERHLSIMRQVGFDSLMIVPMIARERILGAITLVATNESGHHFTEADLALAEGLAARAALAIDNARLYQHAQDELRERRLVQDALRTSEERFRFALANSPILVYVQDADLRYLWVYNGALNAEQSDIYGKTDRDFLEPEDGEVLTVIKQRVLQTGIEERHLIRATRRGEAPQYLDARFAPVRDDEGRTIGITGTAHDVTERKKVEDALAQHQAEIEALNTRLQRSMRETHHRVKNNLQVIIALVNLQQLQYLDQIPTLELARLNQHIKALASIHDLLTHQAQTDTEVSHLSIEALLKKLVPTIQSMVEGHQIRYDVQDIQVPIQQGTAFAVMVNELVSNAVKHGGSQVLVAFSHDDTRARLVVSDDGPGFPPDFDPVFAAHTGLDLISSLATIDLLGSIAYETRPEGGARVTVEFPLTAKPEGN